MNLDDHFQKLALEDRETFTIICQLVLIANHLNDSVSGIRGMSENESKVTKGSESPMPRGIWSAADLRYFQQRLESVVGWHDAKTKAPTRGPYQRRRTLSASAIDTP